MKLIKISDEHYIIVDNSEIKKGDYYWNELDKDIRLNNTINHPYHKKITHSTVPKGFMLLEGVNRLSLKEVKELLGEVDVEKKAIKESELEYEYDTGWEEYKKGYVKGYNQAIEDNKDNKYTDEYVLMLLQKTARKFFQEGREYKGNMAIAGDPLHGVRGELKEMLELLQYKTSWEVEFVDSKLKLK